MVAESARPLTLHDGARRLGAAVWLEDRLFELTGRWVRSGDEPALARWWATQSRRHAWRAAQLRSVLPRTHDLDPDDVVAPGSDAVVGGLDLLAACGTGTERLAAVAHSVLPGVVATAVRLRAGFVPIADAPAMRVLDLVVTDTEADREVVAGLLAGRPATGLEAADVADRQAAIGAALLWSGPTGGP